MFHYKAAEGHINDPNGPCFWNGRWHLFYQHLDGRAWAWGHAVSEDLLHWEELPDAILPSWRTSPEDAGHSGAGSCWSGAVCVAEGKAAAVFYGHGTADNCGLYVMTASDPMLMDWRNVTEGAAIPSVQVFNEGNDPEDPYPYEEVPYCEVPMLYDPCIWYEDGVYHILSGGVMRNAATGGFRRQEYLYTSSDLIHWEFRGSLIPDESYGETEDDGACPYFLPWKDDKTAGDHRLLLHFSHQYGPRYVMGTYDKAALQFTPYAGARVDRISSMDSYHAPALFAGTSDGAMLAVYVMHGRGIPSVMSMVHRWERCGEHFEDIAVSPAADLQALAKERRAIAAGADKIELGTESLALELAVRYDKTAAYPTLHFHRKDGTEIGVLSLHANAGSSRKRLRRWTVADYVSLSLADRPDAAPPQIVQLPATEGEWRLTLVKDGDAMEIFFPDAMSIGRRIYGDTDGMYLTLTGGVLESGEMLVL